MKNLTRVVGKKSNYIAPTDSPEDRVNAFIAHWHEQWFEAQQIMGKEVDFDYWSHQISAVDEAHFIAGRSSGSKNSFGSEADYDPKVEKITDCEIQHHFARVVTEIYQEALGYSKYHVYELRFDTQGGWKIDTIFTLFHPPKDPVIEIEKQASILAMSRPDAPFMDREAHIDLNENILFQKDRKIKLPHVEEGVASLERIGVLQVTSGVLGILDFGYDIYDFEPLQKRVKPGEYPVETVTLHNRVAGVRVVFSETDVPLKWHAANTPSGNGVYGVDAGNLAIFDVGHLLELSHLEKESIFNQWCRSGKPDLVSMTGKDDCIITPSGFGDGAYPAFWGVNQHNEIVSLYIDFMILVQETDNGLYESI